MQYCHSDSSCYPNILTPEDLTRMSAAAADAYERLAEEGADIEKEAVAKVVFRFYRRGLVEPKKLADVAVMVSESRLFQRER